MACSRDCSLCGSLSQIRVGLKATAVVTAGPGVDAKGDAIFMGGATGAATTIMLAAVAAAAVVNYDFYEVTYSFIYKFNNS